MEQKKDQMSKKDDKLETSVSRTQSQDALDSSSASSLSFFAEQSDTQNGYPTENEKSTDGQKSGECSPRAPMDEALKSEKAFIEFVMSLPPRENSEQHHTSTDSVISKAKSPVPASSTTKVGLDHLDNLCKLMEQLSELRETNQKLQRRVQYLEDLKTLHDMHKEINDEAVYTPGDAVASRPRQAYELQKSATETCCPIKEDTHIVHSARTHSKYQSRRGRAVSADGQRRERSKSVGHEDTGEDTKSKRIFPRWSKVKEAFGWESDRKDSVKMKIEYDMGSIRAPRRCSDDSHHSSYVSKSPSWIQDYPSLHSSLEDVHEILDSGRWKRISVASEKNVMYLDTPKESLRRQKSTPSPGSEKLISFKDVSDLKPKSSTIERDSQPDYSKFDRDDGKRGKGPWGRVKTIIERRRDSLKRRSLRREHVCGDTDSPHHHKKEPEVAEMKSYADYVESTVRQAVISDAHKLKNYVPDPIVIDEEVDYGGLRTPSSSPTFHRKSRWTRVKKALKGKKEDDRDPSSTPASPNSNQDGHFTFDVIEEIAQDAYDDGREIKRVGSDSHVHQMSLSAPTCDLMMQLQRNLSDDFHRKIMEWERIRATGNASCSPQWDRKPSMTIMSRKKSERDDKNIKPKLKDLTWLEKELQKIEKEKQRLSKERQKYEERAMRLEKLKETVLNAKNSNKREVFVRTSAGEFRFEGISDAFTKKLYEWETKRGLGPELSTIALLDSSRLTVQPSSVSPRSGPLQRVVSRSESSIADIGGQPSHNSSNSLPSLKVTDSVDADRTNQPSRANSEPDLSTLAALKSGNNVSMSNLSRRVGDSLDDEITTSPGVSRESEDELEKKRNDSETYYGLLEENVILLEQLKDKEEICGRLQTELEVLDKKVEVMNQHHTQETERYREKLWEMHKPGATPRDVQCCLLTMSQLRKRIEALEKCTEKLRNDRESVEDSFRYHSKQQEDMTLDLLQKMSELQAAGSTTECEVQDCIPPQMNSSVVERLQDLSALLVKQTQELQETLSTKTKQICQLRWELLHRDLSTVKLETELHTHMAHRKRSKYAHYRSHSSEEASTVPLPQELECGKTTLIADAYYNVNPDNEFQATELTNTVQQLNRELLKLAGVTEQPQDQTPVESYLVKSSKEIPWAKTGSQMMNLDKSKQITVRRSSADNVRAELEKDKEYKRKDSCSSDSDDSSDDGYTRISLHPNARNNYFLNPNAERLLMSSGEHPPRGYLQRRKKFQKMSKNSFSPSRRRSNTFHNKRDFEKPAVCENTPQKCNSFRLPSEKNSDYSAFRNKLDSVNIQNMLGEVRHKEFLRKRAQMCQSNKDPTKYPVSNNTKIDDDERADYQWLREVSSDSKIPLLFQLVYQTDEIVQDKHCNKYPVRSQSDKRAKESVALKRENYQNRRNKKHLTSPDLLANLNESLRTRILAKTNSQQKILSEPQTNSDRSSSQKDRTLIPSNIPHDADSIVTVQLPKRKSRKAQPKITQDNSESTEQTITIVIPKKRSLSSEKESEYSSKTTLSLIPTENFKEMQCSKTNEDSSVFSNVGSKQYDENEILNPRFHSERATNYSSEISVSSENENEKVPYEQTTRKRKAEDGDSVSKDVAESENTNAPKQHGMVSSQQNTSSSSLTSNKENVPTQNAPNYIKSPSAPHLDWRKACAKKVSREGAPNVRSLIEKYNKVAESQQFRSPNSSNLSSPTWSRKISAPLHTSTSDHVIPAHSFSTPTTPSVISASTFYNPLVFKPINLDLFPKSAPESPLSAARSEAIRKAKEQFISSQNAAASYHENQRPLITLNSSSTAVNEENLKSPHQNIPSTLVTPTNNQDLKRMEDDRLSNYSMDSMNLVMFRTGENCQESRFSKRSIDYSRTESDTLERRNNLKTSKSLSNSSIFKSVLSSDFKMPSSLMKLKRSKKKKDMGTVSQLCRQSLLLTTEDTGKVSSQTSHKSCPSSPELKNKSDVKPNWFHRNILRHK